MKEKNLKIIIGLMSVALLGLIAVQIYWIKNAIELEEKLFDYNVNDAMHSVVKKISQHESAAYVINKLIKPDADDVFVIKSDLLNNEDVVLRKKRMWVSSYNYDVCDSDIVIRLEAPKNVTSSKVIVEINTIKEVHKIGITQKRIISSLQIDSIKVYKEKFVSEVVEELILIGETQNVEERVNERELNNYIKINLINNGISADFLFGVKSERRDTILFLKNADQISELKESLYRAQLFPEELFRPANYLVLSFPNRTGYLLRSISTVLLISALFIFSIIFLYYKTVQILIRQKKVAEIKNDLINNITHEFKTPIATIALAAEALKEPELNKDRVAIEKYSTMIGEESDRLKHMVDSLLNTALIENGEYSLEKSEIDIHSLIKNLVNRNKLRLETANGEIVLELLANNYQVFADQHHITNILNNIVDNAIKYSRFKPLIKISSVNKGDGISISISDNGIGIDKHQQKKIFDTFYRVPTGNIQDVRGYGIGLSYVKKLVEAHGGIITVESKLNKGTTFNLFLPHGR
ncbi:MAG: HAMP domain-containing histidine kinase [Bacteroidetes bacterium]|nr:HAMP domain-containing histidine kinase [Bacteroidota bacterium]